MNLFANKVRYSITDELTINNKYFPLFREFVRVEGIPQTVRHWDVFYRNSSVHINHIAIVNPPPVPGSMYIAMQVTQAHVRLTTAPGGGLETRVRMLGVVTD